MIRQIGRINRPNIVKPPKEKYAHAGHTSRVVRRSLAKTIVPILAMSRGQTYAVRAVVPAILAIATIPLMRARWPVGFHHRFLTSLLPFPTTERM